MPPEKVALLKVFVDFVLGEGPLGNVIQPVGSRTPLETLGRVYLMYCQQLGVNYQQRIPRPASEIV